MDRSKGELQLMLINYKFIYINYKQINTNLPRAFEIQLMHDSGKNVCTNVSIEAPTGTGNVLQLLILLVKQYQHS